MYAHHAAHALLLLLVPTIALGQTTPPPGHYQVDLEATIISEYDPSSKTTSRTDGATGDQTVVAESLRGAQPPRTYKGKGPVTTCVGPAPDSAMAVSHELACRHVPRSQGASTESYAIDCKAAKVDILWRKIDDRTWEATVTNFFAKPHSGRNAPKDAMETALRMMPPEERAKREAELKAMGRPDWEAMERARAFGEAYAQAAQPEIIAMLEQAEAEETNPEAKAHLRQQLAIQRSKSGAELAANPFRTQFKERFTRIADTCKAAK